MNKKNTIYYITILLALLSGLINISSGIKIADLKNENKSLKGKIEMQQSVIADLEENLKNK